MIQNEQHEPLTIYCSGIVGTEEIYFATTHLGINGCIEVTASHNSIDCNGMKLLKEGSKPISQYH